MVQSFTQGPVEGRAGLAPRTCCTLYILLLLSGDSQHLLDTVFPWHGVLWLTGRAHRVFVG